jgi:hypothetical protein
MNMESTEAARWAAKNASDGNVRSTLMGYADEVDRLRGLLIQAMEEKDELIGAQGAYDGRAKLDREHIVKLERANIDLRALVSARDTRIREKDEAYEALALQYQKLEDAAVSHMNCGYPAKCADCAVIHSRACWLKAVLLIVVVWAVFVLCLRSF